jgi:hypothetical protein
VRGIPSPFIKIYERGRDTPHPSLRPLLPRKDLFAGLLPDAQSCTFGRGVTMLARLVDSLSNALDGYAPF